MASLSGLFGNSCYDCWIIIGDKDSERLVWAGGHWPDAGEQV
jgi:hypothetical protein